MTPPSPTLPNSLWANSQRHARRIYTHNTFNASGQIGGPSRVGRRSPTRSSCPGLAFTRRLPWLLFALLGGALVDRLDRRRLVAAVDAFRSAALGLFGFALLLELASLSRGDGRDPLRHGLSLRPARRGRQGEFAGGERPPLRRANFREQRGGAPARRHALCLRRRAAALPTGRHLRRGRADLGAARTFPRPARSEGGEYALPPPSKPRSPRALLVLAAPPAARPRAHRRGDEPDLRRGLRGVGALRSGGTLGPVCYGALAAAVPVGGVLGGLAAEPVAGALGTGAALRAGLPVEAAMHIDHRAAVSQTAT